MGIDKRTQDVEEDVNGAGLYENKRNARISGQCLSAVPQRTSWLDALHPLAVYEADAWLGVTSAPTMEGQLQDLEDSTSGTRRDATRLLQC